MPSLVQFFTFPSYRAFVLRGLLFTLSLAQLHVWAQPSRDYVLVYQDEFERSVLNLPNIYPQWGSNECPPNNPDALQSVLQRKNLKLENGWMRLFFDRDSVLCNNQLFRFSHAEAYSPFDFQYGYFELSGRIPQGFGIWPAFWLYDFPDEDAWREIDIFEFRGLEAANHYEATVHFESDFDGKRVSQKRAELENDCRLRGGHVYCTQNIDVRNQRVAAEFRKYGVEWTPDSVVFYFNDRRVYAKPNVNLHRFMKLMLGNGLRAERESDLERNAYPQSFDIDYVRVYKKRGDVLQFYSLQPALGVPNGGDVEAPLNMAMSNYYIANFGEFINLLATHYPGAQYEWSYQNLADNVPQTSDEQGKFGLIFRPYPKEIGWKEGRGVHITVKNPGNYLVKVTMRCPTGYVETKELMLVCGEAYDASMRMTHGDLGF